MPQNVYQIANKKIRGRRINEQVLEQLEKRELLQYGTNWMEDAIKNDKKMW